MAHVLKIIPKGFRARTKIHVLNCLEDNTRNIQCRLDSAAKAKQQLEADVFERENKIRQSILASQNINKE